MMVRRILLAAGAGLAAAGLACSAPLLRPTATPLPSPTAAPTATAVPPPTEAPPPTAVELPTALVELLEFEEYSVPDEGVNHIADGQAGNYAHYPPSSGEHYGQIIQWDYYIDDVPPEYYVHNLEHGGIVVLYNCPEPCPEIEAALEQFFVQAPPEDVFNEVKIVVATNPHIETRVVALAWGYQLDLPHADVAVLLDFYRRHVNQGPELAP